MFVKENPDRKKNKSKVTFFVSFVRLIASFFLSLTFDSSGTVNNHRLQPVIVYSFIGIKSNFFRFFRSFDCIFLSFSYFLFQWNCKQSQVAVGSSMANCDIYFQLFLEIKHFCHEIVLRYGIVKCGYQLL